MFMRCVRIRVFELYIQFLFKAKYTDISVKKVSLVHVYVVVQLLKTLDDPINERNRVVPRCRISDDDCDEHIEAAFFCCF